MDVGIEKNGNSYSPDNFKPEWFSGSQSNPQFEYNKTENHIHITVQLRNSSPGDEAVSLIVIKKIIIVITVVLTQ